MSDKMMVTPEAILKLAESDPRVARAVSAWQNGELTWAEAMMSAVIELATYNEQLKNSRSSKP